MKGNFIEKTSEVLQSKECCMAEDLVNIETASKVCFMDFGRVSLCNHLMRIISTYVSNTKKSGIL